MENNPDDYDLEWIKYVYDSLPQFKYINTSQLIVTEPSEQLNNIKYEIEDPEDQSRKKQVINLNINNARVLSQYSDNEIIRSNGVKYFDVYEAELNMPITRYNFQVQVDPILETWNNQLFINNGQYQINSFILNPLSQGLDKDSTFTINVKPKLESKTITIDSNTQTTVNYDSQYEGLSDVTIITQVQPNLETWSGTKRFRDNGLIRISDYMDDSTKDGISKNSQFTIDVEKNELTQLTNQRINNTGYFEFLPPNGYQGLSLVSGIVDLSSKILSSYTWEPLVLPMTFDISVYNQQNNTNYIGFSSITVSDTNITPQSIKIKITQLYHPDLDSTFLMKINIGSYYQINDRNNVYMFLYKSGGFYKIYLVLKTTSSSIQVTNNSEDKMIVFRIDNTYGNEHIKYLDENGTEIIFTDSSVGGSTSNFNITSKFISYFSINTFDFTSFFS